MALVAMAGEGPLLSSPLGSRLVLSAPPSLLTSCTHQKDEGTRPGRTPRRQSVASCARLFHPSLRGTFSWMEDHSLPFFFPFHTHVPPPPNPLPKRHTHTSNSTKHQTWTRDGVPKRMSWSLVAWPYARGRGEVWPPLWPSAISSTAAAGPRSLLTKVLPGKGARWTQRRKQVLVYLFPPRPCFMTMRRVPEEAVAGRGSES